VIRRVTKEEHPDGGWTFESLSAHTRKGGSGAGSAPNTVDQLERLTALRDKGALTPEEYEIQKTALLRA
jgi:Short C-terminal domain